MPTYDRSVTVTSDGVVTVVRQDGTEEEVARLRPMLDTQLHTQNLHAPVTAELDPSWTFTAASAQPEWTERGTNEAGPAGHEHDWQPYTDTTAYEACGTWGCGAERKRVRSDASDRP